MKPLVTNDLANDFDALRGQLVDNFIKIQQELDRLGVQQVGVIDGLEANDDAISKAVSEVDKKLTVQANTLGGDLNVAIDNLNKQLVARINRITLGTDDEAIRLVVTEILEEKGVIN